MMSQKHEEEARYSFPHTFLSSVIHFRLTLNNKESFSYENMHNYVFKMDKSVKMDKTLDKTIRYVKVI